MSTSTALDGEGEERALDLVPVDQPVQIVAGRRPIEVEGQHLDGSPGAAASLRGPILALAIEPHANGVTKLAGTDMWRIRVGDLRVVFAIHDAARLVIVLRVARRAESTYRSLR